MRKYELPLKEVLRFLLRLTRGNMQPNASFLAQLIDYEVEILGSSSMEELSPELAASTQKLSAEQLGLFFGPQGDLDSEEAASQLLTTLKSLMISGKWTELAKLNEKYRDEDFGSFPLFQLLVRRALYLVVCMQLNFVVEKVPTLSNPTPLLINNYLTQTAKSIADSLGSSPQLGYLDTFHHAATYTLSITNSGVGSIVIDHISAKLGAAYRQLHTSKSRSASSKASSSSKDAHKEGSLDIDALFEDIRSHARMCFGLFKYLQADSNLSSYLQQYENALANRLLLFLPVQDAPTHPLLALEDEIAAMLPHPLFVEVVRKMLADINKVPELNSNFEASLKTTDVNSAKGPKLEVALLDASVWPVASISKSLTTSNADLIHSAATSPSHGHGGDAHHHHDHPASGCCSGSHGHSHHATAIPTTKLPQEVFSAWGSFKSFAQPDDNGKLLVLPHLGDAQIEATFGDKQYTLDVTTPMMLVLCGLEELEEEVVTFEQLLGATNLPPKLLAQTLYSLSQPSMQILIRRTDYESEPLIKEDDRFQLNDGFTSKLRRFKVPNLKYPPSK